jgi:hypothetical protein
MGELLAQQLVVERTEAVPGETSAPRLSPRPALTVTPS